MLSLTIPLGFILCLCYDLVIIFGLLSIFNGIIHNDKHLIFLSIVIIIAFGIIGDIFLMANTYVEQQKVEDCVGNSLYVDGHDCPYTKIDFETHLFHPINWFIGCYWGVIDLIKISTSVKFI